jgi:hypothetical protein
MKHNKHPRFYNKGSHNMVIERVIVAIKGESEKGKKMGGGGGGGGGLHYVMTKKVSITIKWN